MGTIPTSDDCLDKKPDLELTLARTLFATFLILLFLIAITGNELDGAIVVFSPLLATSAGVSLSAMRRRVQRSFSAWVIFCSIVVFLAYVTYCQLSDASTRHSIIVYWRRFLGI